MALCRKVVKSALRSSGSMRTFWRSVASTAERDCRHQTGSGGSSANPGSLMGWASGLALASGLGLVQVFGVGNNVAKPLEEECINGFCMPGVFPMSDFKGQDSDGRIKEVVKRRKSQYVLPDSYRRRICFNYEKGIRIRSSPEKVFEKFSSVKRPNGELLMTYADLMRAVVPVHPPSDSDVVTDGFLRGEQTSGELKCPSEFFKLFDTDGDGLISFPEYIFFVTLLSVPESDILATFKMFDLDHDGKIDREEFKKVMKLMRAKHRQGTAHRDGRHTGLKIEEPVDNGGLVEYFFGEDGKRHLELEFFQEFIRNFQKKIIHLEFQHYDYQSQGTISAKDFALSMIASADMNHRNHYLDRLEEMGNDPNLKSLRISLEEFQSFFDLRKKVQLLALAMLSFGEVYGLVTKKDFQRAVSHVCNVSVTDNLVAIIFYVFDTNKDGSLSTDEFLRVLDRRERDINYSREYGVVHLLTSWLHCTKQCHSECIHT